MPCSKALALALFKALALALFKALALPYSRHLPCLVHGTCLEICAALPYLQVVMPWLV